MIRELLTERNIPALFTGNENWEIRKQEIIDLLLDEEYGRFHLPEGKTEFHVLSENPAFAGGTAVYRKVEILTTFEEALPDGSSSFSFTIHAVLPKKEGPLPSFVHVNFVDSASSWLLPIEEIIDRGFAYFGFCYRHITEDLSVIPHVEKTYSEGILPFINMHAGDNKAGTFLCWAWACMKTLDYALTCPEIDPERTSVTGHSRLGKTALLAGMLDERFRYIFSCDSGCAGAGLFRGNTGETFKDAADVFPYWFCTKFLEYERVPEVLPFDQHFLLAACAPRHVYISGAHEDLWSDNNSMFLSCAAASEAWEKLGFRGLVAPDRLPDCGDAFQDGRIGFHVVSGPHNMGRKDWNLYMDYLEKLGA